MGRSGHKTSRRALPTAEQDSFPETLEIEKLLSNGHGLARTAAGAVVFIPGALAGERIRVRSTRKRKGVLWAVSHERLGDAPARVTPNCPHFQSCGGCELLHLSRKSELRWKQVFLEDGLKRIAKVRPPDIIGVDFPTTQSRNRGKFRVEKPGLVGFRRGGSHGVTEVPECLVIPGSVRNLLPSIAATSKKLRFRGDIYFATDATGGQPVLEWVGDRPLNHPPHEAVDLPGCAGLLFSDARGKHMRSFGNPRVDLTWNHFRVFLEPSCFFQSNPASWPYFFKWVGDFLDRYKPARVWDVHAGAGFLTSCLSGPAVWASEPENRARVQLEVNLKREMPGYRLFAGSAEQALDAQDFAVHEVDAMLLDPPRTGLSQTLTRWIVESGPPSLLYFSCDIGSFCRDVHRLSDAYRIASPLLAMNLNPGTLRLEVAAMFERFGPQFPEG